MEKCSVSFCQNRILLERNDNLLWVVMEGPTGMISQLQAILQWIHFFKDLFDSHPVDAYNIMKEFR